MVSLMGNLSWFFECMVSFFFIECVVVKKFSFVEKFSDLWENI